MRVGRTVVCFNTWGIEFDNEPEILVFTIVLILVNMLGLMYFWGIELNAISVVNLVMVSCFSMYRLEK